MTHSDSTADTRGETKGETRPVLSPCIGVCVLDASGEYCVGCLRTGGEIAEWTLMSDSERERVMGELDLRARESLAAQ